MPCNCGSKCCDERRTTVFDQGRELVDELADAMTQVGWLQFSGWEYQGKIQSIFLWKEFAGFHVRIALSVDDSRKVTTEVIAAMPIPRAA